MSNRTLFNCKVVMAGALLASVSWGRAMANDIYYSCGISEQNVLQIQNQLKFVVNLPDANGGIFKPNRMWSAIVDEQADHAPGPERRCDRAERGDGVLDDLQHAVAEHQVGGAGGDQALHRRQVSLPTLDQITHTALGCPPVEGGQRIGARIDDGDAVAALRQRNREPPGAATGVQDRQRRSGGGDQPVESGLQPVPDDDAAHRRPRGRA